ncbi:hypothetical protein GCM10009624_09700 [Gordonia sinesedis]
MIRVRLAHRAADTVGHPRTPPGTDHADEADGTDPALTGCGVGTSAVGEDRAAKSGVRTPPAYRPGSPVDALRV